MKNFHKNNFFFPFFAEKKPFIKNIGNFDTRKVNGCPLHTHSVQLMATKIKPSAEKEKFLFQKEKINIRIKSFDFFYIKTIIEKLNSHIFYIHKGKSAHNKKDLNVLLSEETSRRSCFAEQLIKKNFISIGAREPLYRSFHEYNFIITPVKIEKFTVERSPHIDKKSREQFQRTTYSCLLSITIQNYLQQYMLILICKQIKKSGVFIEIESKFFDFF